MGKMVTTKILFLSFSSLILCTDEMSDDGRRRKAMEKKNENTEKNNNNEIELKRQQQRRRRHRRRWCRRKWRWLRHEENEVASSECVSISSCRMYTINEKYSKWHIVKWNFWLHSIYKKEEVKGTENERETIPGGSDEQNRLQQKPTPNTRRMNEWESNEFVCALLLLETIFFFSTFFFFFEFGNASFVRHSTKT